MCNQGFNNHSSQATPILTHFYFKATTSLHLYLYQDTTYSSIFTRLNVQIVYLQEVCECDRFMLLYSTLVTIAIVHEIWKDSLFFLFHGEDKNNLETILAINCKNVLY